MSFRDLPQPLSVKEDAGWVILIGLAIAGALFLAHPVGVFLDKCRSDAQLPAALAENTAAINRVAKALEKP